MDLSNDIALELYAQYKSIERDNYQQKIRFVERNHEKIAQLSFKKYFSIQYDYLHALYEVGAHYQYINNCDTLIEMVIEENIYEHNGKDVYAELLHMKAKASYNIIDYTSSNKILEALIKIDKHPNYYKEDFIKNKIDFYRYKSQRLRAASIVIFLISAIIIAVELLVIRSFYSEWANLIEVIRNICFGCGLIIFVYIEISIRTKASDDFQNIVNHKN